MSETIEGVGAETVMASGATALFGWNEFVAATGGRTVGPSAPQVTGISIDTRTLQPGDAFFAIQGDRFDGHDFASQAMRAGASVLVIDQARAIALSSLQIPKIVAGDVLKALESTGQAARARTDAAVLAVTGSVGKTTTKEMLRAICLPSGETHAAKASHNNHWGVPLTLSRMPASTRFGVFEIGMNHAGEIRTLVKMVRPQVAAITRIAPAHLGQFDSVNQIAAAKAEILEGIEPGGTAVLNHDDDYFKALVGRAREVGVERLRTFGTHENASVRLIARAPGETGPARVSIDGIDFTLSLALPGRHNVMNALCALAVATAVGVEPASAVAALSRMEPVAGRGTRETLPFDGGTIALIDESYNANPASMEAALEVLGNASPSGRGRRVAVLGDMLELGAHAPGLHAAMAEPVLAAGAELVLLVGDEMTALAKALEGKVEVYHRPNSEAMAPLAFKALRAGDVVMVKASNGTGLGRFVTALRHAAEGAEAGKAEAGQGAR